MPEVWLKMEFIEVTYFTLPSLLFLGKLKLLRPQLDVPFEGFKSQTIHEMFTM